MEYPKVKLEEAIKAYRELIIALVPYYIEVKGDILVDNSYLKEDDIEEAFIEGLEEHLGYILKEGPSK